MLGKLKGFISEAAFYGLANVFSRFFVFFLTPLYIGLLGDKCYANITIYQLIFTVASFAFALNSGVFFYYYDYTRELLRNKVFATWMYYQLFAFVVLFIAGILLRHSILSMIDITTLPGDGHAIAVRALVFMLLQFIPFMVVNTFKNYCRIQLQAKVVMWVTLGETIFSVLFIFIFIRFLHMNIDGVMLGQLVGRAILIPFVMTKKFRNSFNFNLFSYPLMKRLVNYSWPYFLISVFFWVITSVDKFVGSTQSGKDSHDQVAFMSLAAMIVMPITLLVEIIRQSIGPFVMNIKNEKDSRDTYSLVFTFVLLLSLILSTAVLAASPLLIQILSARKLEFYECLKIIPMLVLASIMSVAIGQFSIGCNLTKKNVYIAVGSLAGGLVGFGLNVILQPHIGILASGIGQVISFFLSMIIIFYYSDKFFKINYEWKWIGIITAMFIIEFIVFTLASLFHSYHILTYSLIGTIFMIINLYMMDQKFHVTKTLRSKMNL